MRLTINVIICVSVCLASQPGSESNELLSPSPQTENGEKLGENANEVAIYQEAQSSSEKPETTTEIGEIVENVIHDETVQNVTQGEIIQNVTQEFESAITGEGNTDSQVTCAHVNPDSEKICKVGDRVIVAKYDDNIIGQSGTITEIYIDFLSMDDNKRDVCHAFARVEMDDKKLDGIDEKDLKSDENLIPDYITVPVDNRYVVRPNKAAKDEFWEHAGKGIPAIKKVSKQYDDWVEYIAKRTKEFEIWEESGGTKGFWVGFKRSEIEKNMIIAKETVIELKKILSDIEDGHYEPVIVENASDPRLNGTYHYAMEYLSSKKVPCFSAESKKYPTLKKDAAQGFYEHESDERIRFIFCGGKWCLKRRYGELSPWITLMMQTHKGSKGKFVPAQEWQIVDYKNCYKLIAYHNSVGPPPIVEVQVVAQKVENHDARNIASVILVIGGIFFFVFVASYYAKHPCRKQPIVLPGSLNLFNLKGKQKETQEIYHLDWTKLKKVGQGTFAVVSTAINHKTGCLFAVKSIWLGSENKSEEHIKKLTAGAREIDTLVRLNHENVIRYYGYALSSEEDELHIFMEYISGGTLRHFLNRLIPMEECSTHLEVPLIQTFCRELLHGIKYLHDNNIIHRDLKPANILISRDGILKLADFGCAYNLQVDATVCTQTLCGTPGYMAPEIAQNLEHTTASDIFSFGAVVFEMTVGRRAQPVSSNHAHLWDLQRNIVNIQWNGCDEKLPVNLVDMVNRSMHIDPEQRPTVDQLLGFPFILETLNTSSNKTPRDRGAQKLKTYLEAVQEKSSGRSQAGSTFDDARPTTGTLTTVPEKLNTESPGTPELSVRIDSQNDASKKDPGSILSQLRDIQQSKARQLSG